MMEHTASFDHSLVASPYSRSVPNALGITFFGVIANVASYADRSARHGAFRPIDTSISR